MYNEVTTLRKENLQLREDMKKVRAQMETLRNLYANEEVEEMTTKRRLRNNIHTGRGKGEVIKES